MFCCYYNLTKKRSLFPGRLRGYTRYFTLCIDIPENTPNSNYVLNWISITDKWNNNIDLFKYKNDLPELNINVIYKLDFQVVEKVEAIPFKTEKIETADLPEGEEKVQTVGVNGEQKITTTTPMLNNKPYGEATVSKETTKTPVNQVVLVGTGKIEQVVTTSTKPIPFTTEFVENPDLLKGEEKVIQEGVDGVMTITTTTPTWKGQVYGEVTTTEKVTTQPIEKIVEVGVGTIEVKEDIQTKPIAYETKIVENPNMLEGTEKVTQVGVEGELTITTKTQYLNGKVLSEPIVIKERTKEPVTEIIEKGIGVIEEKTEIAKIELPYETQYEVNTNLDKMGQQVKQAGVMGESIRITVTPYLNGKVYGEPVVTEEITKKPVTEVIEVGEGLVEPVIEKTTEAIDYETETIGNADLEVGVKNVKQAGVKGELTRTTTTYFIFGKQYGESEVSEEITLEPVKEIIEVGTKVVEDKQSTEKTTDSESNKSEKPVKVNSATTLPNAGEIDYRQVFTPAALTILAGLGLIVTDKKRKPENE
ncbi:G5 domain-containing protein [Globicatella sanguinis]